MDGSAGRRGNKRGGKRSGGARRNDAAQRRQADGGPTKERLQKVMAAAGVASRRNCEELILEGAVRVNREVVDTLPAFVDPGRDVITVNGRRIHAAQPVYYLLNKPKGVICTNSDPMGRKKAIDIVESEERIFCVGRLDTDTTGAIILTNDPELTNRLTHPRYELAKTYEVRIAGRIEGDALERLKKGIWLSEGKTNKAAVKVLRRTREESIIEITIKQGLNRQIRRSVARIGFKVKGLKRVKIGNISVKGLAVGAYRKLTISQVEYLKKATGMV
jgi:23S rRNA pseudouridine2605 synthase